MIGSQIIFMSMIVIFTSMIRQRISVPDLIQEKSKIYVILFSSIISVCSMIGMTLYKEKTYSFTKKFTGLADNILFITFLGSSIVICFLSFIILKKIDIFGVQKDSKFLYFKKIIIALMTVNFVLYLSCLIIISYYEPIITIEKNFTVLLMIMKEVNAILFLVNYLLYILTIKYDLNFVQLNLEMIPDMEFFIDREEYI